jgi:hypothetical protein
MARALLALRAAVAGLMLRSFGIFFFKELVFGGGYWVVVINGFVLGGDFLWMGSVVGKLRHGFRDVVVFFSFLGFVCQS